ncbi:MAG: methyltransferase domain-containing protein [Thermoplasmata archaeon]|nr:MAG: methyltransferase domain-containing protein [Thermoplasmata archaeon]
MRGKKLEFKLTDVNKVYEGPVGILWEMLMGEQIHVGGAAETDILATKIGLNSEKSLLDVCSALGGPARYLARNYGCKITGLDGTQKMIDEANRRTEEAGLTEKISYKLGDAQEMPFSEGAFDIVWGQDAWCYVEYKDRLIKEAHRVLKPGGIIAFTDWLQVGNMTEKEWVELNTFMVFPYMETLDGYEKLLVDSGFELIEKTDLSKDFARHCHVYQDMLRKELKPKIIEAYGEDLFNAADFGLDMWVKAADERKVGRGRLIAKKK